MSFLLAFIILIKNFKLTFMRNNFIILFFIFIYIIIIHRLIKYSNKLANINYNIINNYYFELIIIIENFKMS
jgi:hypothetical protein